MRGGTIIIPSPAASPMGSPLGSPIASRRTPHRRLLGRRLSESPTSDILFAFSERIPFVADPDDAAEVAARWSSMLRSPPSMSPPPPPAPPAPRSSSTRRPQGPPPPPEPVPLYSPTSIWSNQEPPRRFDRDDLIASVSDTLASVMTEMDQMVSEEEELDRQAAAPVENDTHLERVLSRVRRRRTPHLVVRLPAGGYSYAPSRLYSPVHSPTQSFRRRSDRPLLRQIASTRAPRPSANFSRSLGRRRRTLSTLSLQFPSPQPPPPPQPPQPPPSFEDNLLPITLTPDICPRGRCAICLIDFKDNMGKEITWVNCQSSNPTNDHVFCYACIQGWIAHSGRRTCPECRGAF